jgi:hypothetical protein
VLDCWADLDGQEDTEDGIPTLRRGWLQDLELMHHYTQQTCPMSLGSDTTLQYLWQEHVPLEATKHPFLMHGLLAFAALHLALSRPLQATKYARLCDEHEAIALVPYRKKLETITGEALNALFAFSSILCMSSMAKANLRATEMPETEAIALSDICELLYLTRGVREIKETSADALFRGPFWVMLVGHGMSADIPILLSPELQRVLQDLESMIHESCAGTEQLQLCKEALQQLRGMYEVTVFFQSRGELKLSHIWSWAANISSDFIKLLQAECPPALVITAYFTVAIHMMRDTWYVSSWGSYALNGICVALKGNLAVYISWPLEQIATDSESLTNGAAASKVTA